MTAGSPVEAACSGCDGIGRNGWDLCIRCDGVGREWVPGAPLFGCRMTLADRKVGELVTLGNGDRGRIQRHNKRGTPTTSLALIGEFTGTESPESTSYPSCVGVASVSDPRWSRDEDDGMGSKAIDDGDPLQRRRQL